MKNEIIIISLSCLVLGGLGSLTHFRLMGKTSQVGDYEYIDVSKFSSGEIFLDSMLGPLNTTLNMFSNVASFSFNLMNGSIKLVGGFFKLVNDYFTIITHPEDDSSGGGGGGGMHGQ